jgi:hypothetical protein
MMFLRESSIQAIVPKDVDILRSILNTLLFTPYPDPHLADPHYTPSTAENMIGPI